MFNLKYNIEYQLRENTVFYVAVDLSIEKLRITTKFKISILSIKARQIIVFFCKKEK
jgi:hypothetical protein